MIEQQSVRKSRVDFAFGVSCFADPYANRFLYTGREFLQEVNLYDYRNRVYSAELGRFLQTDPIRFDAGDVNLYRYVANSVPNETDSLGLQGGKRPPACRAGQTKTSTAELNGSRKANCTSDDENWRVEKTVTVSWSASGTISIGGGGFGGGGGGSSELTVTWETTVKPCQEKWIDIEVDFKCVGGQWKAQSGPRWKSKEKKCEC